MQMAHASKQSWKSVSEASIMGASKLLSGITPPTAKEGKFNKSDDNDGNEDGKPAGKRVQQPGGGW